MIGARAKTARRSAANLLALFSLWSLEPLALDLAAAESSAGIFGHAHRTLVETQKGVLYLNPGSAGPRRFALPSCSISC